MQNIVRSYNERIANFATDPDLIKLDDKYDAYLSLNGFDYILDTCKISKNPQSDSGTALFNWVREKDLPTELKRDILFFFNKHFVE